MLKCFIVAAFCVAFAYGECGKCPEIPKHYEELKCTPVKDNPSDCCPSFYNCPDIKALDQTKCHYSGKSYALDTKISTGLPTCTADCTCSGDNTEVGFSCTFDSCSEVESKQECAGIFTINSCCPIKTICEQEEIKKLPRCWSDGIEFVQGNLIYPSSAPCHKCLCDDKFDNSTHPSKSPSCIRVDCGIELHQLNNLQHGCIPVYFNDQYCCPLELRCPNKKDTVIPAKVKAQNTSPDHQCKYGDLVLNIGDSVSTGDPCLECTCVTPPSAQCVRTINTEQCH